MNHISYSIAILAGTLLSNSLFAQDAKVAREIHTGIAFPSLHRAAQENAAGLLQQEVVAIHGEYGPPLLDADSHIGKLVGTLSYTNLALSLGYQAEILDSETLQKFFSGGAFQYQNFSAGAGMTTPIDAGDFNPSLHVGFGYELSKLRLALVFDRLDNTDYTQAVIGAGLGVTHSVNIEINAKTPPFAGFSDPGATQEYLGGLVFYNKRIGLGGQGGVSIEKQAAGNSKSRGRIEVTAMYRITTYLAATFSYNYKRGHFLFGGLTLSMLLPGLEGESANP